MDDLYKPSNKIVENAHINKSKYEDMYKESISNPIKFWSKQAWVFVGKRNLLMNPAVRQSAFIIYV